jgi:TolB protein
MKPLSLLILASFTGMAFGQNTPDLKIVLSGGKPPTIALPDMRGAGGASALMDTFNKVVYNDVNGSGLLKVAAKSFYPMNPPQQDTDLRAGSNCQGRCLADWSAAPLGADWVGFGYAAEQNGQLVVYGNLYNTAIPDLTGAKAFRKVYMGELKEDGARLLGHQYAADLLKQFGAESLAGTKIYFVSDRTGHKEIWVMDHDGANQRQITRFGSITTMPSVSPDGRRVAFTTYADGSPRIKLYSAETGRYVPFRNLNAPINAQASFTPDGQKMLFCSSVDGYMQIYSANPDGTSPRRISNRRAIEAEPKVNPKNGSDLVFVSGRGGLQQIYRMNMDGADAERLTTGEGEASNPAWSPNGQFIAFAWTRGFAPGNWNVFIMDVATRETVQLTHGEGRNENPTWAPDGRHLVFSSNRNGKRSQIYTMLANGTEVTPLTSTGNNWMPVWSR